jgi:hypothetical protein
MIPNTGPGDRALWGRNRSTGPLPFGIKIEGEQQWNHETAYTVNFGGQSMVWLRSTNLLPALVGDFHPNFFLHQWHITKQDGKIMSLGSGQIRIGKVAVGNGKSDRVNLNVTPNNHNNQSAVKG